MPFDASRLKSGNPPTALAPLCRETRPPQWLPLVDETNPIICSTTRSKRSRSVS
ncbi:MAG: hypothetical protein V7K48_01720 [Nostoc sp.]|uniref:hypothetical protein n=1 Tax=Nostoc sp. TaxID=1180 RepID=UPI002FF7376C